MKLPFDFGIKLIFRLVFPGFVIGLGLFPLLDVVLRLNGWLARAEYAFVILVILMGWLITISDMWIYMLMEGRRFWPVSVKDFFIRCEQYRLAHLQELTQSPDDNISAEAYFDLRNFPMTDEGDYEVILPSRLGNQIYAFERYSRRIYGMDAIFYWPRLWLKLDKDTREEIDSSQALVDSSVYMSFALFFCGLLWVGYGLLKLLIVWLLNPNILSTFLTVFRLNALTSFGSLPVHTLSAIDQLLPRKGGALTLAVIFLCSGFLVYRLSLYLHAQFGEIFKSVFDMNARSIRVASTIDELRAISAQSPSVVLTRYAPRKEQYIIAARYLQYYRYRCPACNHLLKPIDIKTHVCVRQ